MVTVLAIDPGKCFGWALFTDGSLTHSGDFKTLGMESHLDALEYLTAGPKYAGVDVVVVEDVVKGSNTMKSWEAVWSCVGTQYLVNQLVPPTAKYVPIAQQTLKAYLRKQLGIPGKSSVDKKQIVAYINSRYKFSLPQNAHNQCDAIALAECYLAQQEALA